MSVWSSQYHHRTSSGTSPRSLSSMNMKARTDMMRVTGERRSNIGGGTRRSAIFFIDTFKVLDTLARYIHNRFKELFEDDRPDNGTTPERAYLNTLIRSQEQRFVFTARLSKEFARDMTRVSIVEYYLLAEDYIKRIEAMKDSGR